MKQTRCRNNLNDQPDDGHRHLRSSHKRAFQFDGEPNGQLEKFMDYVTGNVFSECHRARSRHLTNRSFSNVNSFSRSAINHMRLGEWGAIPTDKDGGFAIIKKMDLLQAMEKTLNCDVYRRARNHDCITSEAWEQYVDFVLF